MGPRDRPSPLPDGASCTACGAPVPTGRIRLLASRDGLAFVRLVCDDCGSAALGLLVDDVSGDGHVLDLVADGHVVDLVPDGHVVDLVPDGHVLDLVADGTPPAQLGDTPAPITAADVEAVRQDLADWTGDLVGWLER